MKLGIILALVAAGGVAFFVIRRRQMIGGIGDETNPLFVGPPSDLANLVSTGIIRDPVLGAVADRGSETEKTLAAVA